MLKNRLFTCTLTLSLSACIYNPSTHISPVNEQLSNNQTTVRVTYQHLSAEAQQALISPQLKTIPFLQGENVSIPEHAFADTLPAKLNTPEQPSQLSPMTGNLKLHLNGLQDTENGLQTAQNITAYQVALSSPSLNQLNQGKPLVKRIPATEQAIIFQELPAEPTQVTIRPLLNNQEVVATLQNEQMLIAPGHVNKLNAEFTVLETPSLDITGQPLPEPNQMIQVGMVAVNGQEMRQQSELVALGGTVVFNERPAPLPPPAAPIASPPDPVQTSASISCSSQGADYSQNTAAFALDTSLPSGITFPPGIPPGLEGVSGSSANQALSILYKGIDVARDLNLAVISGASACAGSTQISALPGVSPLIQVEAQITTPQTGFHNEALLDDFIGLGAFSFVSTLSADGESTSQRTNPDALTIGPDDGDFPTEFPGTSEIQINISRDLEVDPSQIQETVSKNNTAIANQSSTPASPSLNNLAFTRSVLYVSPGTRNLDLASYLNKTFSDGRAHPEYTVHWTSSERGAAIVNEQGRLNTTGLGRTYISVSMPDFPNHTARLEIIVSNSGQSNSVNNTGTSTGSTGSSGSSSIPTASAVVNPFIVPSGRFELSKYRGEVGETITITPRDLKGSFSRVTFHIEGLGSFNSTGGSVSVKLAKAGTFRASMLLIDTQGRSHAGQPSSHLLTVATPPVQETRKIDVTPTDYSWAANQGPGWTVQLGTKATPRVADNQVLIDVRRQDNQAFAWGGIIRYYLNGRLVNQTEYPKGARNISRSLAATSLSKTPQTNRLTVVLESYNEDTKQKSTLQSGAVNLIKYY